MGTPNKPNAQELENRKTASNTFIEQTKLLVSLASAFIVAPAAVLALSNSKLDVRILAAETLFIFSVLAGYVVLGSITGSQFYGEYDVYRPATMWSGRVQFFAYLFGLVVFIWWLITQSK